VTDEGLHLHHVGYAVPEIGDLANTYARRYGYEIVTPVIHDPIQTALVQFLRLPGDGVYLEFVAPDGPESRLAGTMRRRGGLNHLCYTSGNLEETVERMKASGMLLFRDPQPATAFGGRRICWLIGDDWMLVELLERRGDGDLCLPGAEVEGGADTKAPE